MQQICRTHHIPRTASSRQRQPFLPVTIGSTYIVYGDKYTPICFALVKSNEVVYLRIKFCGQLRVATAKGQVTHSQCLLHDNDCWSTHIQAEGILSVSDTIMQFPLSLSVMEVHLNWSLYTHLEVWY